MTQQLHSGICLKERKTLIQKDICFPLLIAALFTISKIWKQPKCPSTDEWIKKMWYIYIQQTTIQAFKKKNEILPFATTSMDLEGIMLSEMSWTDKIHTLIWLTYMWNLKNKLVNILKRRESHQLFK